MFERFTDRARRVIVIAQDEAKALGHDLIGPEHLLLGLFQAEGVAAAALNQEGSELDRVRQRLVEAAPPTTTGKQDKLPFSPQAKKTLELSLREALRLGHHYIGTEHLLLGILRGASKDGGRVRAALDVDCDRLQGRVVELLRTAGPRPKTRNSAALDEALDRAGGAAGKGEVTTGHLVAAVVADPRSQAAVALAALGVNEETLTAALSQVALEETSDGRARFLEVKVGDTTTTIDDPELIESLRSLAPDQLRAAMLTLKQALSKRGGTGDLTQPVVDLTPARLPELRRRRRSRP